MISVTNQQTSPTTDSLNSKQMLGEQHAMAKAKKPRLSELDIGNDAIAAALKQMHDAVASEELPDDFLRLLDEIDTKIAAKNEAH
jgi:hypothetical protein